MAMEVQKLSELTEDVNAEKLMTVSDDDAPGYILFQKGLSNQLLSSASKNSIATGDYLYYDFRYGIFRVSIAYGAKAVVAVFNYECFLLKDDDNLFSDKDVAGKICIFELGGVVCVLNNTAKTLTLSCLGFGFESLEY